MQREGPTSYMLVEPYVSAPEAVISTLKDDKSHSCDLELTAGRGLGVKRDF